MAHSLFFPAVQMEQKGARVPQCLVQELGTAASRGFVESYMPEGASNVWSSEILSTSPTSPLPLMSVSS